MQKSPMSSFPSQSVSSSALPFRLRHVLLDAIFFVVKPDYAYVEYKLHAYQNPHSNATEFRAMQDTPFTTSEFKA